MLLRYAINGVVPVPAPINEQIGELRLLREILELDGFLCEESADIVGTRMPLIVQKGEKRLAVATYPSLIMESSLREKLDLKNVFLVDDAQLRIDVPGVHSAIKARS
ncbi:hypothetical protein B0G73_108264 [Paraburkholderia sp. BL25I1N1]|nr:hypothetical protein B0G73_108264 [Paraburkholderia sp. BL25I1N1]